MNLSPMIFIHMVNIFSCFKFMGFSYVDFFMHAISN